MIKVWKDIRDCILLPAIVGTAIVYFAVASFSQVEAQIGGQGVSGSSASELRATNKLIVGPEDVMVVNGSAINSTVAVNSDTISIYESHTHATSASGAVYYGAKSRGSTGSEAIVADNDQLAGFYALGFNGDDYSIGGRIDFAVDGTPGDNDMPTELRFWTTPDGSTTSTIRGGFRPDGTFHLANVQEFTNDTNACSGGLIANDVYHNSGALRIVESCP